MWLIRCSYSVLAIGDAVSVVPIYALLLAIGKLVLVAENEILNHALASKGGT